MNLDGFITAESRARYKQLRDEYVQKYDPMLHTYHKDYTATIQAFPSLRTWLRSLDDCNWQVAADIALWKQLAADGFLMKQDTPTEDVGPTNAKHRMQLVNPRVLDVFHAHQGRSVNYAFNEMRVCVRKNTTIPPTVKVPAAWTDVCIIDTEIFDLPPEFVGDLFDDREKIHVIYLVGREGDAVRHKAIYIGISSGEPYGAGPRKRESSGRFRFYRFDVKDKWQCEYIKLTIGPEWAQQDVTTLPDHTNLGENEATLLYGRSFADASHVCLSDPLIRPVWEGWIAAHPHNHLVFRTVTVERMHEELKEPHVRILRLQPIRRQQRSRTHLRTIATCTWPPSTRNVSSPQVGSTFTSRNCRSTSRMNTASTRSKRMFSADIRKHYPSASRFRR